eukprot:1685163-Karenia_brevis.AAC.1
MTLLYGLVPVLREFADFHGLDPNAEGFANASRWLWTQKRTSLVAEDTTVSIGEDWSAQLGG